MNNLENYFKFLLKPYTLQNPLLFNEQFVNLLSKGLAEFVFDISKDTYKLVEFPESQQYMDEDWFQEEACIVFETEKFGNAAYFIPLKRILEYENKENN